MTIKDIKNNQELLNAYNNMLSAQNALNSITIRYEAELRTLKGNLKHEIRLLMANPHYRDIAAESEKTEIQTLLDSLN